MKGIVSGLEGLRDNGEGGKLKDEAVQEKDHGIAL